MRKRNFGVPLFVETLDFENFLKCLGGCVIQNENNE